MSKYIDLADKIIDYTGVLSTDIRVGIREALSHLDGFPDQVPGPAITESDYSDITEWARNYNNRGWEGRAVLAGAGITIAPDPEPTNAERLADIYRSWCGMDEVPNSLIRFMDEAGVTAPEEK